MNRKMLRIYPVANAHVIRRKVMEASRRSVIPHGTLIDSLRKRKGWTIEDMATEARIGMRTAQKVVAGQPVSMETVERIAKVLGEQYESLLAPNQTDALGAETKQYILTFSITASYETVEDEMRLGKLFNAIKVLLHEQVELSSPTIHRGSVLLSVTANEAEVGYYLCLFRIVSSRVISPPAPPYPDDLNRPSLEHPISLSETTGRHMAAAAIGKLLTKWQRLRIVTTSLVAKLFRTSLRRTYLVLTNVNHVTILDRNSGGQIIYDVAFRLTFREYCEAILYPSR